MCQNQKNACPPRQILHLVANLDGYGLTRQLELLVTGQLADGKKVRVVALRASREGLAALRAVGVECRVLDRRWRFDPVAAIRLRQEICRLPADLIHVWGQSASNYLNVVRRWTRPTTISTSNSTPTLVTLPETLTAPGIPLLKTSKLTRQQFLNELQLPQDSILITVAGPLTRSQQIDEAIWHYELVRTLDERLRLLIFGDGPDRPRVERFARLTSEPHSIRFLGYRDNFRELLPHTDLFWHTGIASKALPLTVLEAMTASVPVVANCGAANCESNSEPILSTIIDDGVNGYLIANNDRAVFARQTRKLLADKKHAGKIASTALRTVVERYSVDAMMQAFTDAYDKLLVR